jgi:hypothetical protein
MSCRFEALTNLLSVVNPKTKADSWFETYLEQEGYSFEHEPPWRERTGVDTRKQPDYLVEHDGQRVVCEVKEFATTLITDRLTATANPNTGVSVISVSDKEMFGAVRRQVQEAAKTLKPFAACGLPLVVVLCKPARADAHLGSRDVISALFGNPIVRLPLSSTGERIGPAIREAGKDGVLTNHHRYISAVVAIHRREQRRDWIDQASARIKAEPGERSEKAERLLKVVNQTDERGELPTGSYFFAESFENALGNGPNLSRTLFTGERDSRWGHIHDTQYGMVFGPVITAGTQSI